MSGLDWPLNVPVLTDGQVTLRAHVRSDIDRMLAMAQDPEMVAWTAISDPHTRAESERFAFEVIPDGWNEGTNRGWAIEFEGRYAGNVDLRGAGPLADIGFALHPDCRGESVMTSSVRLAITYAFVEAGIEAITWRARVGNIASLRVAHATGFRLHELVSDLLCERGQIIDGWTASIRFGDPTFAQTKWHRDPIETERLTLRPPTEADLARWAEAEADEATSYWANQPAPTVSEVRDVYYRSNWRAAKGTHLVWTVADRETDRFCGQVMIGDLPGSPEIGYFMHPDSRGLGLMTEAVDAVSQFALDRFGLNLTRLNLSVGAGNTKSAAIARTCGYKQYGQATAAEQLGDGTLADLLCFELVR